MPQHKLEPPPFPLAAFRGFIKQTIDVSDCYKSYDDKFLRRDVQDMYLGAKWLWYCLTANFEERITAIAEYELEATFSGLGRKKEDYGKPQLTNLLNVRRNALSATHARVLVQTFEHVLHFQSEERFTTQTNLSKELIND